MEEKVLSSIGGVGAFGVFSVCLFFVFFTGMIVWVTRLTQCYLHSMGQLPLAEEEAPTGLGGNGTRDAVAHTTPLDDSTAAVSSGPSRAPIGQKP